MLACSISELLPSCLWRCKHSSGGWCLAHPGLPLSPSLLAASELCKEGQSSTRATPAQPQSLPAPGTQEHIGTSAGCTGTDLFPLIATALKLLSSPFAGRNYVSNPVKHTSMGHWHTPTTMGNGNAPNPQPEWCDRNTGAVP